MSENKKHNDWTFLFSNVGLSVVCTSLGKFEPEEQDYRWSQSMYRSSFGVYIVHWWLLHLKKKSTSFLKETHAICFHLKLQSYLCSHGVWMHRFCSYLTSISFLFQRVKNTGLYVNRIVKPQEAYFRFLPAISFILIKHWACICFVNYYLACLKSCLIASLPGSSLSADSSEDSIKDGRGFQLWMP